MSESKVLLLGATGLVGGHALKILLDNEKVATVYTPTRRPLEVKHEKLINPTVDFSTLTGEEEFFMVEACYCALGSTIKKAGSQEAFKQVDHDLVIQLAQWVFKNGCQNFAVISSVGADATSSNFYLKTKGQMEEDLRKIGFQNLKILNPGLIIGKRNESRPLETLSQALAPLFDPLLLGPLKKYRSIKAQDLAHQLVADLD